MTGDFDNWTKSIKLDKVGTGFEKTVEIKDASQKIYYKVGLCARQGIQLPGGFSFLPSLSLSHPSTIAVCKTARPPPCQPLIFPLV